MTSSAYTRDEYSQMIDHMMQEFSDKMNQWEWDFLQSIYQHIQSANFRFLTYKQHEKIVDIYARLTEGEG